ncbi:uncharacterized protein LOC123006500 [Tribolium madens]|uniref:uncharacterized protein LOC123006500 n=1 Tax=Tribolium madens TaxID=41895 RepID=UPI001CF73D23|nr:uncharacterized protein LOC123006500 [Tribolium madens]
MVSEFNDPFIMLRKIFFNNSINDKITKFFNVLLIIIYSLVHSLQIYYMYKNFSMNLLVRYSPTTLFVLFAIVTTVFSVAFEKKIFEMSTILDQLCWPLSMIQKKAQIKIERKCQIINIFTSIVSLVFLSSTIVNSPWFGSQKDFFICFIVFEEYFGEWSFIPYYCYFVGITFLYYHFLRACFLFVYGFLEVQLQFFLIEEYLSQIYEIDDEKNWDYLQDIRYQEGIGKSLRLCIKHHNDLKKLVKMIVNIVLKGLPLFVLFGILLLISSMAFIINFADTMTNIIKIRIYSYLASNLCISILLCWIGQQLINVSSNIFFTLAEAPWYFWNRDNRIIFLIFMTNCIKNESIVLAGICVDYQLIVSVLRTSASYVLVFYNLRKNGLV